MMKPRIGTYRYRRALVRRITSRSGTLARLVRFPNPLQVPWRRPTLDIARDQGLGDVLMCTPALRELKSLNPNCHVRFYTNFETLVRGLPYIDEVLSFGERPSGNIYLGYEDAIPPRAHFASIMGDKLGIKVHHTVPDCIIQPELVERFRRAWRSLPHPHVVILRRAGRWTPNKDWPDAFWRELIESLSRYAGVIEIGQLADVITHGPDRNYVDLRGRTSLDELVAAIAASDIHVGPPSGPIHIAAAARRPSVVIFGGYEHPSNSAYPGMVAFYTPVPCAPCWLREPCPHNRKCLTAITPATVEQAVRETWARRRHIPIFEAGLRP